MRNIKKYAMMAVKAGVGLMPKALRNQLKKSPGLEAFYSQTLLRSGLFYGYPSPRKINALYQSVVKRQRAYLASIESSDEAAVSELTVLIIAGNESSLKRTFASLAKQSKWLNSVIVLGGHYHDESADFDIHNVGEWQQVIEYTSSSRLLALEAGDTLPPLALFFFAQCHDMSDIAYCDTDEMVKGSRCSPRLLPDWNPDLQLSSAYIATGVVLNESSTQIATALKYASSFSSVSELVTALWLAKPNLSVTHHALSLVHHEPNYKKTRSTLSKMGEWLESCGVTTKANEHELTNSYQWPLSAQPLVSLIIPTKNAHELVRDCITSIIDKTQYDNYEILLVDNNSDDPESLEYFDELALHPKVRLLKYPQPFNYSAINNYAVSQARGDIIGLVNNDVEVISGQWLSYMVGHAQREDIGCVGAKLLYSDGRIQHAGVVLGYGGGAGHAHKYFPRYHPGYLNRLIASHNYCAVTAACLLVKRTHYEAVGGLNEKELTVAFNDVDFCLKVRELGVRNLYCAEAELFHHESVSRGLDSTKEKRARFMTELSYLQTKWRDVIRHDPAYNAYLTLKRENFSIKEPGEH